LCGFSNTIHTEGLAFSDQFKGIDGKLWQWFVTAAGKNGAKFSEQYKSAKYSFATTTPPPRCRCESCTRQFA
jgi:hypothetical protein